MSIKEQCEIWEAAQKNKLDIQTWGHLFPNGKKYEGKVKISFSIYGDIDILDEKIDIEGSPWWFDTIQEFALEHSNKMKRGQVNEVQITVEIEDIENKYDDGEVYSITKKMHVHERGYKIIIKPWN